MFKIFYGVLLSVLILVVSIACSSAPPEEYVTQVEYNKLLTHTSELEISLAELETRLSTLQLLVLTDIVRLDYEDDENAKSITKARGAFAWFGTN